MAEILFLSKGENSPSTRYRAMHYFARLAAAGHRARHLDLSGGAGNYLAAIAAARQADLVLVLRKTLPGPLLWGLRRAARRLVFDLDDAVFCNTDGSASSTRMSRFKAMVAACDHVTAGNGFLAANAAQYNSRVSIVPTSVDVDRYRVQAAKPEGHFDIAWIGSSSTRKYLEEAVPPLREASRRLPGLRLKIIADFDLDAPGFPTVPVRWRADTEAYELASAHVGIAPMRDDDWSRGKCALKVLQYMAAGLPVVSSPAGVNAEAVMEGQTGFLAEDQEAWVERLVALAVNPQQRAEMGRCGRQRVEDIYSLDVVAGKLLAVIDSALGTPA